MKTLAERLAEARKEAKLSQGALARKAGCGQSTIGSIERGRNQGSTILPRLAEILNVSALWLAEGRGEKRPSKDSAPSSYSNPRTIEDDGILVRMRNVPVVGTTRGGPTCRVWTDGDLPTGEGFGWVSVSSRDRNAFALRVEGSSMAPRYEHGEYVLVEPNRRPEPGDDVIVRLRGGECMIKRLAARRPHELALDSLNASYDRITVAPDEVEYMYFVAAGLRAGSFVMHIQADGYEGPERRWHDEPVEAERRAIEKD